jgi:phage tail-like protein
MDVNNTPYFLLRSEAEFEQASTRLQWHTGKQALTLAQNQSLRLPASDPVAAITAWQNATPMAVDRFYQVAGLSADKRSVEFNSGRGFLPLKDGELNSVSAPVGTIKDLSLNQTGRLAIPYSNDVDSHGLMVFDLAKRWLAQCDLPVAPRRAWVDSASRVWCVSTNQLVLCEGQPLPLPYQPQDARFEPMSVNPTALSLSWQQALPSGWETLAICGEAGNSGPDQLYILMHDGTGAQRIVCCSLSTISDHSLTIYELSSSCPFVIDLKSAGKGRLAAMAARENGDTDFTKRDCPILALRWDNDPGHDILTPRGHAERIHERYPMLSLAVPRFASCADGQLRYQAELDPDYPDFNPRPRELHALRQPRYHLQANALLHQVMDSGAPNTVWHRVYLDACIPPGCSITLSARVYDTPEQRGSAELIDQPAPQWNALPSELAFQSAFSGHQTGQRGLFEVLLQRPDGPMRRMNGRFLQLQVHFTSNGRVSPSLHAIRVYHPRFSYQEAYLPELYRQELSYDAAHSSGPANGADFRERLLANFEGLLTPIEGRIAASDQLLHPDACPKTNLTWLAQSIGVTLPEHWPEARQRRLLKCATLIQQYKGTLAGVNLALDIASDGGVQRGEVVLVENFRLRRTMATILGRNMDDAEHPLTLGTGMSGNSIIGDSLILSDMNAQEFLALFAPELTQTELATADEAIAVNAFFDQYAHKISVLLHGRARAQRNAVEDTLAEHMPAHLQWTIIETERPFVLGTSPLLSIDTYLQHQPEFEPVVLNQTLIGQEGLLKNPAAFSPRDINASL